MNDLIANGNHKAPTIGCPCLAQLDDQLQRHPLTAVNLVRTRETIPRMLIAARQPGGGNGFALVPASYCPRCGFRYPQATGQENAIS